MPTTLPTHFDTGIAGVTFVPDYPGNLHALSEVLWSMAAACPANQVEYPVAVLRRNPDNPHDANAIEVHVPALGDQGFIGHIPARLAAKLAPLLDAGELWQAWVTFVLIAEGHEDRPGANVTIRKIR